MFAQIEGTARDPIATSRSLDTRGVATANPQVFPPYSTTLCVVFSPWAAFRWRGTADDVTQPGPGARHFSYAGTLRKKGRSEQELCPRQSGHRQEPTVERPPSKNRGTVEPLHRDKGYGRSPGPGSQEENSHLLNATSTASTKVRFLVTSLDLTMVLHNNSYQSPISPQHPHDNPTLKSPDRSRTLIPLQVITILSTRNERNALDIRSTPTTISLKFTFT